MQICLKQESKLFKVVVDFLSLNLKNLNYINYVIVN